MNLKLPLKSLSVLFALGALVVVAALVGTVFTAVQTRQAVTTVPSLGAPAIQ